ncbi:MAG: PRC-barrel domain-containing protein [Candidatus Woesearchaeota archaeon]|nr:PRC-barrel domain-containing protein [Candidatus Woesearchaeota archaeon]
MDQYVDKGPLEEETRNIKEVLGMHVLSKSGRDVGTVKELRTDEENNFEGIIINRGLFKKPAFIHKAYIKELSPKAVLLEIDPTFMYYRMAVITSDGKKFGTVTGIDRIRNTNKVDQILLRRWFRTIAVDASEVKQYGASVMLQKTYERAKTDFT